MRRWHIGLDWLGPPASEVVMQSDVARGKSAPAHLTHRRTYNPSGAMAKLPRLLLIKPDGAFDDFLGGLNTKPACPVSPLALLCWFAGLSFLAQSNLLCHSRSLLCVVGATISKQEYRADNRQQPKRVTQQAGRDVGPYP